jgi:hypothetical protein
MSVIIEIDAPQLLPQLVARLQSAGCSAAPIGNDACRVVHRQAETPAVALCELRFFATAWADTHDAVAVRLRPEV